MRRANAVEHGRRAEASNNTVRSRWTPSLEGLARRLRATHVSVALLLDAVCVTPLAAQTEGSVVARLAGSPRAQALADAAAALPGDPGSLFANPAGIVTIGRWGVEGSVASYLEGATHTTAAVAARAGRLTWGAGLQALTFGDEDEIVPDPATGGRRGTATGRTFTASDLLAVGSVVYRFNLFALGVSAKYARQSVADRSADAWAADAGLEVAVFDIAALGFAVQNIGGRFGRTARLPARTRLGLSMNFTDPQGVVRALSVIEGRWGGGARAALAIGLEGGIVTAAGVGLVGRLGYETRGDPTDASPWSVGGGVELGGLRLDYAYRGFAALGAGTHRIGLRWKP